MLENVRESKRSILTSAELWFFTGFGSVFWFSESTKLSPAESPFRNAQDAFLGKMFCPSGSAL